MLNRHIALQSERDQEVTSNQAQNVSTTMLTKPVHTTIDTATVQSNPCQSIAQQSTVELVVTNEKPIQRPTELFSSAIDMKTNVKDMQQKITSDSSDSSCSQCNKQCLCDENTSKSPQIKCDAIESDANKIKTNISDSVQSNSSSNTASTRKINVNKCVGPTSPPNVPILVNRFPNNHPTYLPPHIRYKLYDFNETSYFIFLRKKTFLFFCCCCYKFIEIYQKLNRLTWVILKCQQI